MDDDRPALLWRLQLAFCHTCSVFCSFEPAATAGRNPIRVYEPVIVAQYKNDFKRQFSGFLVRQRQISNGRV
jgi:hypothetical protein